MNAGWFLKTRRPSSFIRRNASRPSSELRSLSHLPTVQRRYVTTPPELPQCYGHHDSLTCRPPATRDTAPSAQLLQLQVGSARHRRQESVSDLPPQIATPFFAPAPAGPPEETQMPDEMNYSPREGPLWERGKTGSLVAFPRAR